MAQPITLHGGVKIGNTVIDSTGIKINDIPVLALQSSINIKTINGISLLGSGDVVVSGGGSTGPVKSFNNSSRYFVDTLAGQTVQCVTTATVIHNLNWSRNGTNLTIENPGHNREVGHRVIVRNTSADMTVSLITSVTADTFTVNCLASGSLSGTSGAYSDGITFAHDAAQGSINAGTVFAPIDSDVQMQSMRIHLKSNSRITTNYMINFPPSTIVGFEGGNNNDSSYIPNQQFRQEADSLVAVANTIGTNINGSFASFRFAALPALTTGIIIAMQF